MVERVVLGQVVGGSFQQLHVRKKEDASLSIGTLALIEQPTQKLLFQVVDLHYGSQLPSTSREFISGMDLEVQEHQLTLLDEKQRHYTIAHLKPLLTLQKEKAFPSKSLPPQFSSLLSIHEEDFPFLTETEFPLTFGKLRSGSSTLNQTVCLNGKEVFNHHLLIAAQTGKGKSNFTKCLLWHAVKEEYCGILVLDAHDEYYGRNRKGLKHHPLQEKIQYYSLQGTELQGTYSLVINISDIQPQHFKGVVHWSEPQQELLYFVYHRFGKQWITKLLSMSQAEYNQDTHISSKYQLQTFNVVQRQLASMLNIQLPQDASQALSYEGIFQEATGETTIKNICQALEQAHTVILDTSSTNNRSELLIGSIISSHMFARYQHYKRTGELDRKPSISFVLEEAPRVIGRDALAQGNNIFSTIAREGRKFKLGLTAITQLPSLIPKDILANLSTKIILGIEMGAERHALIESSAQDLSMDEYAIAALDKGEAILTSNFSRFAIPITIPLFEELVENEQHTQPKKAYPELQP